MVKLTFNSKQSEFSELITKFIGNYNPTFHIDNESRMEAIMAILMGSRNIRLGPLPSIESQFVMRGIVRDCISNNKPIPILIPSGPKKTKSGESIDILELSMLNILHCVDNAIRVHHTPGTQMVFRLEDLTGKVLEPDYIADMEKYCQDLNDLVKILDYNNFIEIWLESNSNAQDDFLKLSKLYTNLFLQYLNQRKIHQSYLWPKLETYQRLVEFGWKGIIPQEQYDMYIAKYKNLYPEISDGEAELLMAKYFASALARKNLKLTGAKEEWGKDFLEIAFMEPIPNYNYPTRFYYRSVELKNSKRAIPFWRAKGFLKLQEDDSIRMSSVTWKEAESMEFVYGYLTFSNKNLTVDVKCDYLLINQ